MFRMIQYNKTFRGDNMGTLRKIDEKIYEMRQLLQELLNEKTSLLDTQVIAASQELDSLLNEYNNLLMEKN